MARYMFIARYASGGVKGVVTAGGSARRAAIQKMAEELGGRLETFDFAFGEDDVHTILELPDNKAAAACALAVNSTGHTSVSVAMSVRIRNEAGKGSGLPCTATRVHHLDLPHASQVHAGQSLLIPAMP